MPNNVAVNLVTCSIRVTYQVMLNKLMEVMNQ